MSALDWAGTGWIASLLEEEGKTMLRARKAVLKLPKYVCLGLGEPELGLSRF